jgi:hypothetical protein
MTEGRLANEGKWDIPIPEINPLGSQNLYQTTRYEKGLRVHGISYIENITENTKNVKDNKFRTSIDMLNVINQCYSADRDTIAAYNIGASIFASILEGDALTAKDKASFLHLWARAPEDASLQLIPCFDLPGEEIITRMKDSGYPEKLINSVKKAKKMIITLDTPVVFDGQKRWAWVEINPDTYEIISVMDTGEHGATEFISLKGLVDDAGKFELGSFIGFVLSIWSVAIYSLELDNYNNILANAYVFAKGIGHHTSFVPHSPQNLVPGGFCAPQEEHLPGCGTGAFMEFPHPKLCSDLVKSFPNHCLYCKCRWLPLPPWVELAQLPPHGCFFPAQLPTEWAAAPSFRKAAVSLI